MRLTVSVIATLTLLLACHSKPAPKVASGSVPPPTIDAAAAPGTCGIGPGTVLTDSGLGALKVGAPTAMIKQQCRVLQDATQLGDEADSERVLLVGLGSDTLVATIDNDRVWRIEVSTPRFRTRDSLGVGSRVAAFRRFHDLKAETGEGPYFLVVGSHCGMSFGLPLNAVPDTLGTLEGPMLNQLADTLRVESVLVFGCHRG